MVSHNKCHNFHNFIDVIMRSRLTKVMLWFQIRKNNWEILFRSISINCQCSRNLSPYGMSHCWWKTQRGDWLVGWLWGNARLHCQLCVHFTGIISRNIRVFSYNNIFWSPCSRTLILVSTLVFHQLSLRMCIWLWKYFELLDCDKFDIIEAFWSYFLLILLLKYIQYFIGGSF